MPVPSAGTVTLRAALEAAWQRAVAARETDGQRRRAEADRAVASSLWAAPPSLALSHRDDRLQSNAGRRETEIGVAVPLWLPGQRSARAGTAEAAAAQAQAAEQVARLRLAGEVREAAWQIATLQAELAQADTQAQSLKQLADDVERRVRAGDLARADALAAQAELLAAAALKADVQQRLQAARSRWTLLTGLTGAPDLTADLATESPATSPTAAHPEQQFASQSTELARQRVELMRRSRRDAPELTVGVRQDTPGRAEASQGSLVVGLRLPFGTDDRNRPLEAAAQAELDVAQTHEQRLRERLDSDIATAREAQRSAQAQLDAETARARLLRERATLIDKSFRAGETPLPDLLRALAAASQADSAAARQTAALRLARARLQHALGLFP
ncbi:outer membrane protein [Burkholderiales bacterium JOSHI_001]|nr:outer membrane protein [Burkholderiales bacterium JOSHI_001]